MARIESMIENRFGPGIESNRIKPIPKPRKVFSEKKSPAKDSAKRLAPSKVWWAASLRLSNCCNNPGIKEGINTDASAPSLLSSNLLGPSAPGLLSSSLLGLSAAPWGPQLLNGCSTLIKHVHANTCSC